MGSFAIANRQYECPVQLAAETLGGKWKLHIVWHLSHDDLRFGELRRRILGNISEKVLIASLKDMQRDGLVERTDFATVPPKVVYSLTDQGTRLLPIVTAMGAFGRLYEVADS